MLYEVITEVVSRVMKDLQEGGFIEVRVASVETTGPSPFATSLTFDFVASFMYEYDAPLAERRAMALTVDRELLRELLGEPALRDLLDPDAIAAVVITSYSIHYTKLYDASWRT